MSITSTEGHAHYPADPDKFEFDSEVSGVFQDMALRSIPMYAEAHKLHVAMAREVLNRASVTIWDIGSSRGHFFKEICNQLHIPQHSGAARIHGFAMDSSPYMVRFMVREFPWVNCIVGDVLDAPDMEAPADIINMMYVLQFIKEDHDKAEALKWAYRNLKNGGLLFLGQKDRIDGEFGNMFSEQYQAFRRLKGYSQKEIDAKTKALRNSMWPTRQAWLQDMCVNAGFYDYETTTQWLQFSTAVCIKKE